MKIYTRTGDEGETGLLGGTRVPKSDSRVEAYGSVDELNALLGLTLAHVGSEEIRGMLPGIQKLLFSIGAQLADDRAADARGAAATPAARLADVHALEAEIDRCQATLPPLTRFVLPGGAKSATLLHLLRTVCRRAERRTVAMSKQHAVPRTVLVYLNRLSDLLFVWARVENLRAGAPEVLWEGIRGPDA